MFEAFFQFGARPFASVPQTERYFPATAIENARKTVIRCIERAEGTPLVIGRTGTGKSLLCQVLAQQLEGRFATALLASARLCTRRALLQAILFELGLPYRGLEESELRLSLLDYLTPQQPVHEALVLVIDEAHTLPLRLLEELRMITNLVRDGAPRVRLILAGGSQLEERFASPKLDSFSQRVSARCYLEPLNRDETAAYIKAQITAVDGKPDEIFDAEALAAVHRATDGVPRLINQVCDHALILASAGGCRKLTAAAVEEAWADLQQLPAPWSPADDSAPRVIEFGGLDERPEDLPDAIPFRSSRDFSAAGATETLDRIEQQLAHLDDEFEPAGSIGPEVELVFHDTGNPFNEVFAEEEVVLDRYASLDENVFRERPAVASREGRELAALLGAHARRAPETPDPAKQSAAGNSPGPANRPEPAARPAASEVFQPDDDDLIIVEDDHPGAPHARSEGLVRRQEYRQLFAKLRRG